MIDVFDIYLFDIYFKIKISEFSSCLKSINSRISSYFKTDIATVKTSRTT